MNGADPWIADVTEMNGDVLEGVGAGFGAEDGFFAAGKEMAVGREVAIDHGEAGFFVVHVERAADDDDGDGIGRAEIFADEIHELWKTEGAIEIEFGRDGTFVRAGEELFEFKDLFFELVRAGLAALKGAEVGNFQARDVGEVV